MPFMLDLFLMSDYSLEATIIFKLHKKGGKCVSQYMLSKVNRKIFHLLIDFLGIGLQWEVISTTLFTTDTLLIIKISTVSAAAALAG